MWVRGLKLGTCFATVYSKYVAPHVGAWIETADCQRLFALLRSHPMWVRGLKLAVRLIPCLLVGRTPCGCVD